jgi:hypothetical protein
MTRAPLIVVTLVLLLVLAAWSTGDDLQTLTRLWDPAPPALAVSNQGAIPFSATIYADGRLELQRAGVRSYGRVDVATVRSLMREAQRSGFFSLPRVLRSHPRNVDLLTESVEVWRSGAAKTVTEDPSVGNPTFDELHNALMEAAGLASNAPAPGP